MTEFMQIHSRVGADGVLNLQVPFGTAKAQTEVLVTIQQLGKSNVPDARSMPWHEFIEKTYGSCAGLGLERPEQLTVEEREAFE